MNTDLTPAEPSNVVALNEESAKELEIRLKIHAKALKCPGLHRHIEVDVKNRILVCKDCDYVVDAFDYIAHWAMEGEQRMTGLSGISKKTQIASAELADLERKLRNVRSQLRRAGHPQSDEERLAYDRQRWNVGSDNLSPRVIDGGKK